MPIVQVPCPHCAKVSRFDSERLPDGPASFACRSCQQRVVVDKRSLLADASSPADDATGSSASITPAPESSDGDPATASSGRFGDIPRDATFPSGIILGEDEAVIAEVQKTMAALGSEIERLGTPKEARERILNEQPALCFFVGGAVPAPPYSAMEGLIGLPPAARRRLYLVLIAENLKTLNGGAAFTYQVNMILNKSDLAQLGAALHSGLDYHDRLYGPYYRAVEPG